MKSTLRRTPVRPVDLHGQAVPDEFAATLRLLRSVGDPRLPMTLRLAWEEGWTFVAMAQPLEVSRERVRQLANSATGHAHGIDIPSPVFKPDPVPKPKLAKLSLSEAEVEWLRQLYESARLTNGATPVDDPLRQTSEQFTAELAACRQRGVSVHMIAKQLGVSTSTIRFRLGRHGYQSLPPSMEHNRYQGVQNTWISQSRSHCGRGHPMSGDNLGVTPKGRRWCRECQRQRDRERKAKASPLAVTR